MWLHVCGGYFSLVNTTTQLLTMADSGGTADIERLRNLNNELLTENSELRSTVQKLQGEYLDARNKFDRTKDKPKKLNNLNKTLTAIFHVNKGKRTKGKVFMAMLIEVGREDRGVGPGWHWSCSKCSSTKCGNNQANESNLDTLGHAQRVSVL